MCVYYVYFFVFEMLFDKPMEPCVILKYIWAPPANTIIAFDRWHPNVPTVTATMCAVTAVTVAICSVSDKLYDPV